MRNGAANPTHPPPHEQDFLKSPCQQTPARKSADSLSGQEAERTFRGLRASSWLPGFWSTVMSCYCLGPFGTCRWRLVAATAQAQENGTSSTRTRGQPLAPGIWATVGRSRRWASDCRFGRWARRSAPWQFRYLNTVADERCFRRDSLPRQQDGHPLTTVWVVDARALRQVTGNSGPRRLSVDDGQL
jgi:hypothetical protein